MRPASDRSLGLLAAAALAVTAAGAGGPAAGAAVLFVAAPGGDGLRAFLVWIVAGAAAFGVLGWAAATLLLPGLSATLLLGAGLAVGGGVGAGARFLATGEREPGEPGESVTVDMAEEERPDPQPADLFEASPDPILYYDATGDGPVVRAVNPAFEATFGVSVDSVTEAGLADALMATEGADRIVAGAADGEPVDETVACETADGTARFRVRVAAVDTARGTRGYVLYTPA
jgi:PAS domain-containing protein